MALTNEEIIAALGEKTLLELAELRDMICEEFGVSATAAVAAAPAEAGAAEEKTSISSIPTSRIPLRTMLLAFSSEWAST